MAEYVIKIVKITDVQEDSPAAVKTVVRDDITLDKFREQIQKSVGASEIVSLHYLDTDNDQAVIADQAQLKIAFAEWSDKKRFRVYVECENQLSHEDQIKRVIEEYKQYLEDRTTYHFGYPYNLHYDHDDIFDLMKYTINNLGDPFVESNYGVHSRKFELDVLAFFAELWKIPEDDYWGYVTSCGTEGNLHSILCAREMHPDGVLYGSEDCHYSIFKAGDFYRMRYVRVKSDENGQMDYDDLAKHLEANKEYPAIVTANIGTTVKGAVDSVDRIVETLKSKGYTRDRWYIHCDGALYALMLPFMKEFEQVNFTKEIDSMCVSGHKFLGCPMPSGVVICRKSNIDKVSKTVEYLNSVDTTIMGSRNGHAPIFLWYSLQKGGIEGIKKKVKMCHANARLLYNMLKDRGVKAFLNERSTTVVLQRPPQDFVKHWQLACEGDIAHVVVMPNVTVEKIVQFVDEVCESFAGRWKAYGHAAAPTTPSREGGFSLISFKTNRRTKKTMEELNMSFNSSPKPMRTPMHAAIDGAAPPSMTPI